jgi:hypothetical protein
MYHYKMDYSELLARIEECKKTDFDNKLWEDLISWIVSELDKKEDKPKIPEPEPE